MKRLFTILEIFPNYLPARLPTEQYALHYLEFYEESPSMRETVTVEQTFRKIESPSSSHASAEGNWRLEEQESKCQNKGGN